MCSTRTCIWDNSSIAASLQAPIIYAQQVADRDSQSRQLTGVPGTCKTCRARCKAHIAISAVLWHVSLLHTTRIAAIQLNINHYLQNKWSMQAIWRGIYKQSKAQSDVDLSRLPANCISFIMFKVNISAIPLAGGAQR